MKTNKWNSDQVPDQTGRIAIVTGSSSGLGIETARVLSGKGATVVIAVRNETKGNSAINRIKQDHPNAKLVLMKLDLASLSSVESFASAFKSQFDRLDLLINNAGVMIPPYSKTEDGFELQFGTNHLGHFLLTEKLFDILNATKDSRIVNVSSVAHNYGKLDFDDLNWEKRKYKPINSYGDSKIANLYFTYELARRVEEANYDIIVTAAHPGWTATELQRHSGIVDFLNNFFAQDISMGALPTLYAAVSDNALNGGYYGPSGFREMRGYPKKVDSNPLSKNLEIAQQLWEVSEKLTNTHFL